MSVGDVVLTTDPRSAGPAGVADVLAVAEHLSSVMARLDPAVVTVSDAMALVEAFCRMERMAGTEKMLLATRATESPRLLQRKGFRDGVDYLVKTLDISSGEARSILGLGQALEGLDVTADAAKQGGISPRKMAAIAAAAHADPAAEGELVKMAETASTPEVQERSRQIRRAASPETDEQRALRAHRRRNVWHRIDDETGDGRGGWQLPPAAHAEVVAELNRIANGYFEQARRNDQRESPGAYMADALVQLVHQPTVPRVPSDPPDPPADSTADDDPPGGNASPLPTPRSRRNTNVYIRIDGTAAERGDTGNGERCEIAGVGPVPVSEVLALAATDAFKAVVVTDPDDHTKIRSIAHLGHKPLDPDTLVDEARAAVAVKGVDVGSLVHHGRQPTGTQVTAVMYLSGGRCQIRGCTSGTGRLEIDHIEPWVPSYRTVLHQLALLCGHCHDLKTRDSWTVGPLGPDAKRDLNPPHPPPGPGPPDTS